MNVAAPCAGGVLRVVGEGAVAQAASASTRAARKASRGKNKKQGVFLGKTARW